MSEFNPARSEKVIADTAVLFNELFTAPELVDMRSEDMEFEERMLRIAALGSLHQNHASINKANIRQVAETVRKVLSVSGEVVDDKGEK